VHGGGPGGLASFDLPVPGYSLAADLARGGHSVYVMDVRGWGRSTRPAVLEEPPEKNSPAVSLEEAARDIGAVVDWIRSRSGGARVALVGWATGGLWCGTFTSRRGDAVSGLAMINSLYGVAAPWPLWNGSLIRVPTLVVRGERDFWSRPADLEGLRNDLVNAATVRTVTIPEATHHLFLDRPDRGRRALLEELLAFLRAGVPRVVPSRVRRPAV
jgi:pimeloyl-ACP methyl ester carboxylesterase